MTWPHRPQTQRSSYNRRIVPLLPLSTPLPRFVVHAPILHSPNGSPVSLLPLIVHSVGVTHLIVGNFKVSDSAGSICLNGDSPSDEKFSRFWAEMSWLQGAGVKVMLSLGGSQGRGTFKKLSGSKEKFESNIRPLISLLQTRLFDGIDLNIVEEVKAEIPQRIIRRLTAEFGLRFQISMSTTMPALLSRNASDKSSKMVPWDLPHLCLDPNVEVRPMGEFDGPASFSTASGYPLERNVYRDSDTSLTMDHPGGFSYPALFADPEISMSVDFLNIRLFSEKGNNGVDDFYHSLDNVIGPLVTSNNEIAPTLFMSGWPSDKLVLTTTGSPHFGEGYVNIKKLGADFYSYAQVFAPKFGNGAVPGGDLGLGGVGLGGVGLIDYHCAGEGEQCTFDGMPLVYLRPGASINGPSRKMEPWEYLKELAEMVRHRDVGGIYTPRPEKRQKWEERLNSPPQKLERDYGISVTERGGVLENLFTTRNDSNGGTSQQDGPLPHNWRRPSGLDELGAELVIVSERARGNRNYARSNAEHHQPRTQDRAENDGVSDEFPLYGPISDTTRHRPSEPNLDQSSVGALPRYQGAAISDADVDRLAELGFSRWRSRQALRRADGNVELAAAMLVDNIQEPPGPEVHES